MGRRKKIKIESPDVTELEKEKNENEALDNTDVANVVESSSTDENAGNDTANDYQQTIAEIDDIIATNETEKKRGRKTKEEKLKAQITIPGSLFVRVHNMVATNAAAALDMWLSKKNHVTPDLLSLDEKTMQELIPVAELAMKEMKIEENPIAAFYIMFGAGILTNYMTVKTMIAQATKENPDFDLSKLAKK